MVKQIDNFPASNYRTTIDTLFFSLAFGSCTHPEFGRRPSSIHCQHKCPRTGSVSFILAWFERRVKMTTFISCACARIRVCMSVVVCVRRACMCARVRTDRPTSSLDTAHVLVLCMSLLPMSLCVAVLLFYVSDTKYQRKSETATNTTTLPIYFCAVSRILLKIQFYILLSCCCCCCWAQLYGNSSYFFLLSLCSLFLRV